MVWCLCLLGDTVVYFMMLFASNVTANVHKLRLIIWVCRSDCHKAASNFIVGLQPHLNLCCMLSPCFTREQLIFKDQAHKPHSCGHLLPRLENWRRCWIPVTWSLNTTFFPSWVFLFSESDFKRRWLLIGSLNVHWNLFSSTAEEYLIVFIFTTHMLLFPVSPSSTRSYHFSPLQEHSGRKSPVIAVRRAKMLNVVYWKCKTFPSWRVLIDLHVVLISL